MVTVPDVPRRNNTRRPEAPAVVDQTGRLTHGRLVERAWAVAGGRGDQIPVNPSGKSMKRELRQQPLRPDLVAGR